jgi:hypothetical protein
VGGVRAICFHDVFAHVPDAPSIMTRSLQLTLPRAWAKPDLLHLVLSRRA